MKVLKKILFFAQLLVTNVIGLPHRETQSFKKNCNLSKSSTNSQNEPRVVDFSSLNTDCTHASFEYLSLKDLTNVCKTCKNLNQATGEYFRDYFPSRVFAVGRNIFSEHSRVLINCLSPFVQSIVIADGDLDIFKIYRFQLLNEIEFGGDLTHIENIKHILPNLETLKFIHFDFDGDLHEAFLGHCGKLKRLYVKDKKKANDESNPLINASNDWLMNKYSSLKHFKVNSRRKIDKVIHFLQRNPNIHKFSTSIEFLVKNM